MMLFNRQGRSMFTQLGRIKFARARALKVFEETKNKFEQAIAKAEQYIGLNEMDIARHTDQVNELEHTNLKLAMEIEAMKSSILEIDKFLGE
jgi:hypothetical protein